MMPTKTVPVIRELTSCAECRSLRHPEPTLSGFMFSSFDKEPHLQRKRERSQVDILRILISVRHVEEKVVDSEQSE
jgi:hypothetical protein